MKGIDGFLISIYMLTLESKCRLEKKYVPVCTYGLVPLKKKKSVYIWAVRGSYHDLNQFSPKMS